MTRILVNKNELERISDKINHLLEDSSKQIFRIPTEQPTNDESTYELDEKEEQIIKYIRENPGSTNENIVQNSGNYSRVTIYKTIRRLMEKGVVVNRRKNKRSRINHLYINYQNIVNSLQEDLAIFKFFYSELVEESISLISAERPKNRNTNREKKTRSLLYTLVKLYRFFCITYLTSDIFVWWKQPLDNDTLHTKFALFFNTMKEVHYQLLKISTSSGLELEKAKEEVSKLFYSGRVEIFEIEFYNLLRDFEEYGLAVQAEAVLDALWKIAYPILPLIDSSYKKYHKNGKLNDWRYVFEKNRSIHYTPKTKNMFSGYEERVKMSVLLES